LYSAGDVVFDQSSGDYYFFKQGQTQASSSFSNSAIGYALFDFGRMVIRIKPTETKAIQSITLKLTSSYSDGVLSMYSALSTCAVSDCRPNGGAVATVEPTSLLGSSTATSGSGEVTYTFSTPINVTVNTNYYLTFTSSCSGTGILGSNVADSDFAFSYGTCSIDQGTPAIKINYVNYKVL
jgi:hypothetical protein